MDHGHNDALSSGGGFDNSPMSGSNGTPMASALSQQQYQTGVGSSSAGTPRMDEPADVTMSGDDGTGQNDNGGSQVCHP